MYLCLRIVSVNYSTVLWYTFVITRTRINTSILQIQACTCYTVVCTFRTQSSPANTDTDQYTRPGPRETDTTPAVYATATAPRSTYETIGEHEAVGPYTELDLYTHTRAGEIYTRPAEYTTIADSARNYETINNQQAQ